MTPEALIFQLEREAIEHAMYENEHVYTPRRVAVEQILLRRFVSMCRRERRSLPPRLQLLLDRVPHQHEKTKWDEIAGASERPDPAFATRDHE